MIYGRFEVLVENVCYIVDRAGTHHFWREACFDTAVAEQAPLGRPQELQEMWCSYDVHHKDRAAGITGWVHLEMP